MSTLLASRTLGAHAHPRPCATLWGALTAAALVLAGCGSSSSSVTGTIDGRTFTVAEAISTKGGTDTNGFMVVYLASKPGLCDAVANGAVLSSAQIMIINAGTIADTGTSGAPTEPNDFPIVPKPTDPGPFSDVRYVAIDASCGASFAANGKSGEISVTAVGDDESSYAGTGTVKLDSGDDVTIAFDTTSCNSLQDLIVGSMFEPTTCQ